MFNRFLLGRIHVDDEVRRLLGRTPFDMVARHAVCDHGLVSQRRKKLNAIALSDSQGGGDIQSEYIANIAHPEHGRIRIVTTEGWADTYVSLVKEK